MTLPEKRIDMEITEPSPRQSWGRRVVALLLSPVVVALSIACTILGFSLGIYQSSQASPKLTFAVTPIRLDVVSSNQSPRLSVMYMGKPVTGDITSARVFLWNAGRASVGGNTRKPVIIRTVPPVPILEATTRPFVKDDVTGLHLENEQFSLGRAKVVWDELEEGEGASIDLLYNGPPSVKIWIEGRVRGQKKILAFRNEIGYDSPMREYEDARRVHRNQRLVSPVFMFASILGVVTCLILANRVETPWKRKPLWLLVLCLVAMFAISFGMYVLSEDPVPPLTFQQEAET